MSRAALLALAGLAGGFLVGFVWGAGTREALPGATRTSYRDGELTITVNTASALREGLRAFLG